MNAVIISGGKQHRIALGKTIKLEKLPHTVGEIIQLDQVLMIQDDASNIILGQPFINGATVTVEVVAQARHAKIHILKMRRRKHYMRRQGHRQDYTEVKITKINHA